MNALFNGDEKTWLPFLFYLFSQVKGLFFFILIGCEKSQSCKTHPTRTRRIRFISENWQEIKINILKFTSNLSGFVGVHLNFWKNLEFSLNLLYSFEINNLNAIRKIFFSRKTFHICFPLKQFTAQAETIHAIWGNSTERIYLFRFVFVVFSLCKQNNAHKKWQYIICS